MKVSKSILQAIAVAVTLGAATSACNNKKTPSQTPKIQTVEIEPINEPIIKPEPQESETPKHPKKMECLTCGLG